MAAGHKIDSTQLEKLWNDGLLDKDIAERLGCATKSVANYRHTHQMPSNTGITDWRNEEHGKRSYSKHG